MTVEHFFQNVVNERYSPNAPKYAVRYIKKYSKCPFICPRPCWTATTDKRMAEDHYGETPRGLRKQGKYNRDAPEPAAFEKDKNKLPQRKPPRAPRAATARARAAALNREKEARAATEDATAGADLTGAGGNVPAAPAATYAIMENTAYNATPGPVGASPVIPVEYNGDYRNQLNQALSEMQAADYNFGVYKPTGPTEQVAAESLALLKQGHSGNMGTEAAHQQAAAHHHHHGPVHLPALQHVPGYHNPSHYNRYFQQYAMSQQLQRQPLQTQQLLQPQQTQHQHQQQHQLSQHHQHQHDRVPAAGPAHTTIYGYPPLTGQPAAALFEYPPVDPQGGYYHYQAPEQHVGFFDRPNADGYVPSLTDGSTAVTPSDNTTSQNYEDYWFDSDRQYVSHVNNSHYSEDRGYPAAEK